MIDIGNVDLVKFAQKVYEYSFPQGLGCLHFIPDPLDDVDARKLVDVWKDDRTIALDMDYIYGRACKMTVFRRDGKLMIENNWYDHSDEQFKKLLSSFNIQPQTAIEHEVACNCIDCQAKRKLKDKN